MTKLPFLVSIPHGGTQMPSEVEGMSCIGRADVLEDGDAFTREIYDVAEGVRFVLKADVARAFVDLNRAENDLPPANPDGVVKSKTCYNKPIYLPGREPDGPIVEKLLARYHRPYHRAIQQTLAEAGTDIILALDCHSMAAVGPDVAPDPGQRRPAFCLGNRHGETCPNEMAETLAGCLREVFGLGPSEVTLNRPFAGGYVTRTHGAGSVPWIQVEMSRDLYLRAPYFDEDRWDIDGRRLRELKASFLATLRLLFERVRR